MTRPPPPEPTGARRSLRCVGSYAGPGVRCAFAVSIVACTGACAPPPMTAAASGPSITASHLSAPPGTALDAACTPTGPELCFNAIDDNCNGVIDEGCGVPTGVLQFMVAWGDNPADVNLALVTPQGEHVPDGHTRSTPSGFHLDRDCPSDDSCNGQNVEDIYFDGDDPPRGRYIVEISLDDMHGAIPPVPVRFGARLGGRSVGFGVELAPGDDARKTFTFDLP